MRYWAYFAGKIAVAAGGLYGVLALLNWAWPPEPMFFSYRPARFGWDLGYTSAVMVWFLACVAVLYVIVWDQRYRCRVCLRRLRMPIETGSWSRMLQFGRPRIEYICLYGHGTLKEDEFVGGAEWAGVEWTPHSDDIWDELCASELSVPSKESGDHS
jgi:hypothetical protein